MLKRSLIVGIGVTTLTFFAGCGAGAGVNLTPHGKKLTNMAGITTNYNNTYKINFPKNNVVKLNTMDNVKLLYKKMDNAVKTAVQKSKTKNRPYKCNCNGNFILYSTFDKEKTYNIKFLKRTYGREQYHLNETAVVRLSPENHTLTLKSLHGYLTYVVLFADKKVETDINDLVKTDEKLRKNLPLVFKQAENPVNNNYYYSSPFEITFNSNIEDKELAKDTIYRLANIKDYSDYSLYPTFNNVFVSIDNNFKKKHPKLGAILINNDLLFVITNTSIYKIQNGIKITLKGYIIGNTKDTISKKAITQLIAQLINSGKYPKNIKAVDLLKLKDEKAKKSINLIENNRDFAF